MRWLDGITNSISGHEFEQTLGDNDGLGAWHAAVHVFAKSLIQLSN